VMPSVAAPGDTKTQLHSLGHFLVLLPPAVNSTFAGRIFTANQQQYTCGNEDLLNKKTSMPHRQYVRCCCYRLIGLDSDFENFFSSACVYDEYL